VSGVVDQWVLLLVTEESLELFEGHVLHVLTVGMKLFTNLKEEGGGVRECV
jgi:hypothetical protein